MWGFVLFVYGTLGMSVKITPHQPLNLGVNLLTDSGHVVPKHRIWQDCLNSLQHLAREDGKDAE